MNIAFSARAVALSAFAFALASPRAQGAFIDADGSLDGMVETMAQNGSGRVEDRDVLEWFADDRGDSLRFSALHNARSALSDVTSRAQHVASVRATERSVEASGLIELVSIPTVGDGVDANTMAGFQFDLRLDFALAAERLVRVDAAVSSLESMFSTWSLHIDIDGRNSLGGESLKLDVSTATDADEPRVRSLLATFGPGDWSIVIRGDGQLNADFDAEADIPLGLQEQIIEYSASAAIIPAPAGAALFLLAALAPSRPRRRAGGPTCLRTRDA